MGSRMMSGNTNFHEELENNLSSFMKKEDTILLNFGYQGIMSSIDALVDRKDVIIYDSECHACIIDGVRLHQGKRFVFPHNNIENFEKQLQRAQKITDETDGGILVITEGVFGMSGDLGKLKEITALKMLSFRPRSVQALQGIHLGQRSDSPLATHGLFYFFVERDRVHSPRALLACRTHDILWPNH